MKNKDDRNTDSRVKRNGKNIEKDLSANLGNFEEVGREKFQKRRDEMNKFADKFLKEKKLK